MSGGPDESRIQNNPFVQSSLLFFKLPVRLRTDIIKTLALIVIGLMWVILAFLVSARACTSILRPAVYSRAA